MLLNSRFLHRLCGDATLRSRKRRTATGAAPLAMALVLGSPLAAIAAVTGSLGPLPKQAPADAALPPCRPIIEGATFTGRTRCSFENGDRYDGSFAAGQMTGTGRYSYGAGGYYEGELRNGVFQGRGVFESAAGDRYEGDFVGGQFQGRGVYVTAGGDRYEGQFSNHTFDGQGTYTYADGRALSGRWQAGQLVESATETIGTERNEPTPEEPPTEGDPPPEEPTPNDGGGAAQDNGDDANAGDVNGEEGTPEVVNGETETEPGAANRDAGALQPVALDRLGRDRAAATLEIAATPGVPRSRRLDVRADALKPPLGLP